MINQLLFADDSALADDSVEKLNRILSGFEKVSQKRNLKVNVGKISDKCSTFGGQESIILRLNGVEIEEVNEFMYSGSNELFMQMKG